VALHLSVSLARSLGVLRVMPTGRRPAKVSCACVRA
jgi:hypothetical protein